MKESLLKIITDSGTRITMPKDIVLNKKYDKYISNYVYLLEEGICALNSITKQGEEKVYLYFRPYRLIGFNQFVVSAERLNASAPEFSVVTKTTCTLYQIPYCTFQELVLSNREFNAFLMETLADNYNDALIHFHLMQEESVVVRLCHLLFEVSQLRGGIRVVPRFFTYAEMAKYLGCHSVTVSRIMAKLKQQGFVTKTPSGIAIEQEDALQELINSDSRFQY